MKVARPSDRRLYLLLALMVTFWSFNYVAGKFALREFPPVLLVGIRTALAGLLLLPLWAVRDRGNSSILTWRELRVIIPLGVLGIAGNQMMFVMGLARTSVAHAGIMIATTPLLVLLIASLSGQERMTGRKLTGMGIAFAGIMVLQLGRVKGSTATVGGDVLVFLGALSFAAFTVMGKTISRRHGGVAVNTVAYVSAGLLLAPLVLWQGTHFQFSAVTAQGWWSVFYMAAFSSVLAYLIYYYALTFIPASRVSGFSYLQPVLATLMAIPLLREPVSPGLLVGGSLALAGVYVTERS